MIIQATLEGLSDYIFQKHGVERGMLLSSCQHDTCKLRPNNSKQEQMPTLLVPIPNNAYRIRLFLNEYHTFRS